MQSKSLDEAMRAMHHLIDEKIKRNHTWNGRGSNDEAHSNCRETTNAIPRIPRRLRGSGPACTRLVQGFPWCHTPPAIQVTCLI
jgi:hypothetical protein